MTKLILFISFFLLLFPQTSSGQNADSLIQSLNKETIDTNRIKTYVKIVKFYNSTEPIKALPYAISLTELAEKLNIEKFLALSYNQLGITYFFLGNTNQSAELFLKVLKINEKNSDSLGISRSLNNIGLVYHDDKAYTKSLEYFNRSLEIKLKLKDYPTLWTTYMNIGLSYSSLNEYDKALNNYFLGLGAWKLLKEEKNESYASIMSEIGVVYQMTDSLDKAEKYLNEAITYYEKSKSSYRVANTLLHLAIVNRKRNNMEVAQNYLDKSLKLIKESGAFSILPDYYLELSNIEESKGNVKKSFDYFKKQQVLKDSLSKEQNLNDMNRMQEMYNIEKQNAETAVLKKEVELGEEKLLRTRIVTYGVISLLIIVVVFSFYLLKVINRWKAANEKLKEQQILINSTNEELKKQRDELEILANELKRLNSDKDRFMSILSHDLKSPFSTILGLSEMLTENIRAFSVTELEDIAINLSKTAHNTYKLLEDLLLWTRAQSGKIPFKLQKLSLSEICRLTLEILNPGARAKGITLSYNPMDEIYVFADEDMLRTVLRNLVSNAIKFTDKNGSIIIGAEETGSKLIVSVSDNGVGISPENVPKLFNNSEILTTPGTAHETGTGFGLLLCKEFVEKHGGRIWAESEQGRGSKFIFSLPSFTENSNGNILL